MTNLIPQDPAPWAARILAMKDAVPFQAFSVAMISDHAYPVTRPEYVEVTKDRTCAKVSGPEGRLALLALEWVVDLTVGGEVGAPSRPPRYAAKLRALQEHGPFGPLMLTVQDGRQFPLAGPHQCLVAPDGRSIAVCEQEGGLVLLATSDITDLAPKT
jgi:hypothetical protein